MALSIIQFSAGDGRQSSPYASPLTDTLTVPANSNTVLYILMANMHNQTATSQVVTLTGETVNTVLAWDNSATNGTEINFGAFAVRNPTAGTKTLSLTDDGLERSFAWGAWLVGGVPASGFVDATDREFGVIGLTTCTTTVTTTKPNGLILTFFGWRGNGLGPFSISSPWVEDADASPGASAFTDVAYEAVHLVTTTAGTYTGTSTATVSGRRGYVSLAVLPSSNRPGGEVFVL